MKTKVIHFALAVILVLTMVLGMAGCTLDEPVPDPDTSTTVSDTDTGINAPEAIAKVHSKWSSGNLVFYDTAGTTLLTIDAANDRISSPEGYFTTVTNANAAMGTGNFSSATSAVITHGLASTPTIVIATLTGTPDNSDNATVWITSINSANFTVNCAETQTDTGISWAAWIAGE